MTVDIRTGQLAELETGARRLATVLKSADDSRATIDIYEHLSALPDWLNRLRGYCAPSRHPVKR